MKPKKIDVPFLKPMIICLGAWAIISFGCISCQPGSSIPFSTPGVTIQGNYADYSYSSKGGLVIVPRTTVIKIRDDK